MLGMPPHAAETTTAFLCSRDGVHQALYLGMDEMAVISEERWAKELWEVAGEVGEGGGKGEEEGGLPKFFILFGKEDKWVANDIRDRFIAERKAHKTGRTRIVVDEEGLPHDFCISEFFCLFTSPPFSPPRKGEHPNAHGANTRDQIIARQSRRRWPCGWTRSQSTREPHLAGACEKGAAACNTQCSYAVLICGAYMQSLLIRNAYVQGKQDGTAGLPRNFLSPYVHV